MKKATDLRQYLTAHVPELVRHPDKLIAYIPKGSIACRAGSLSFQWSYDIELTVTDFAGSPDELVVPLLAWLAINQQEQFQDPGRNDNLIRVEAEIIDHDKSDVQLTVTLTERVIVSGGLDRWAVTHCGEPAIDDTGGVSPWNLFVNGVAIDET